MDKVKEKLHIGSGRRKSKPEHEASEGTGGEQEGRTSYDSEVEAMEPHERVAYLKDYDHAEKTGEPRKGSLLDKLINRGNKKTEEDLAREAKEREAAQQRSASGAGEQGAGGGASKDGVVH